MLQLMVHREPAFNPPNSRNPRSNINNARRAVQRVADSYPFATTFTISTGRKEDLAKPYSEAQVQVDSKIAAVSCELGLGNGPLPSPSCVKHGTLSCRDIDSLLIRGSIQIQVEFNELMLEGGLRVEEV